MNSLLIRKLVNLPEIDGSHGSQRKKRFSMSFTIALFTALFILCTLPYSLVVAYIYEEMISNQNLKQILNFLRLLAFSYHSFNFIIFFITNKLFYREFKSLFNITCKKENRNKLRQKDKSKNEDLLVKSNELEN